MIISFKIFERKKSIAQDWNIIRSVKLNNLSEVKKMLGQIDYEIEFEDSMGWTALLWATYNRNIPMMKLLLDNGASMTHKALHSIRGTKKMVDFYDLVVDLRKIGGEREYGKVQKWIEKNYPDFVAAKQYNL